MEMTLGERIRKARKGNNMTQAELAHSIGVHEITIRRWELGDRNPDMHELQKISDVLGVPLTELFGTVAIDEKSIEHTRQQSNKERSLNRGMLVFEVDGKRFEAPPTDIGMKYLERMLTLSMGNAVPAGV